MLWFPLRINGRDTAHKEMEETNRIINSFLRIVPAMYFLLVYITMFFFY